MDSILANWVNNFPTKCLLVKQVRSEQNLRYLFDLNSNAWPIRHKFLMLNLYVEANNARLI